MFDLLWFRSWWENYFRLYFWRHDVGLWYSISKMIVHCMRIWHVQDKIQTDTPLFTMSVRIDQNVGDHLEKLVTHNKFPFLEMISRVSATLARRQLSTTGQRRGGFSYFITRSPKQRQRAMWGWVISHHLRLINYETWAHSHRIWWKF